MVRAADQTYIRWELVDLMESRFFPIPPQSQIASNQNMKSEEIETKVVSELIMMDATCNEETVSEIRRVCWNQKDCPQ
jgi:hypothetical protein